jgi:hypothetical protein
MVVDAHHVDLRGGHEKREWSHLHDRYQLPDKLGLWESTTSAVTVAHDQGKKKVTGASYNLEMAWREMLTALTAVLGLLANAAGQNGLPATLNPPAGERLSFQAHATGDQIYVCRQGTWTFQAPEAKLFDAAGRQVGKHFAGPTWESTDGSQVKGKLVASAPSPDPEAIPWLLLTAAEHHGSGVMTSVTSIQRFHTKAGKAPKDACDAAREGTEAHRPYQADYLFYAR